MGSSKRKQDVVISAGDDRKKKAKTVKDSGKGKKEKKDKDDADYSKKDSKKDYKKKKPKQEDSDDEESEIELAPKGAEVELTFDGTGPGYKPLEDSDEEMEGDEEKAGAKGTPGVALPGWLCQYHASIWYADIEPRKRKQVPGGSCCSKEGRCRTESRQTQRRYSYQRQESL